MLPLQADEDIGPGMAWADDRAKRRGRVDIQHIGTGARAAESYRPYSVSGEFTHIFELP